MNEDNTFVCSFVSNHYVVCGCGETLEGEEAYQDHLENSHNHWQWPENNVCVINEFVCGTCDKIFNTKEKCIEHQNIHVIYVKEEKNDDNIIDNLSIKEETHEHDYIADTEHHHVDDSIDIKRYTFVPRSVYSDPTQKIYRVESSFKKENVAKKQKSIHKVIVCDICNKQYVSHAALRYHKRIHSGLRPYACLYCPKRFTMPLFQQIHMRVHTGERPYQCHVCPKAFSNKAALLRHDRVHSGEKPYICPKCGKGFSQSNSLKLHVHTVHMKLPAPYKSRRRREAMLVREARLRGDIKSEDISSDQTVHQEESCRTKQSQSYYNRYY